MARFTWLAAVLLSLLAAGAAPLASQDAPPKITTTEAHLLTTLGAPGGEDPFWVLTLQHFSLWRYGSNFFFVDLSDDDGLDFLDESPGLYLEYAPVLSLGALGIVPAGGAGSLRDVGLTAQVNAGHTVDGFAIDRVFLEGVELAWSVPRFAVFNTQLLARQERGYDPSWQVTWAYVLPFRVGPAGGLVQGFLDVWRRDREGADGHTVLLAQPQLLLDLGSAAPGASRLQVGIELEPSYNFPVAAASDGWNVALSPMVRWVF